MKKRVYSLIVTASMFFSILPVKAELINPDDLATDGKIVENVARSKEAYRASNKSSLSGWTNGVENDDGQFNDVNWLQGYGSGDYGIVDLSKPYSIAAVGIMSTEMPWHHAPTEIYGTNDPECSLNASELIATITMEDAQSTEVINNAIRKSVVRANGGKYRYIMFKPVDSAGDGLIVKEVYVYAYLSDEFGAWNITDNGEERSFQMPVTYINPSEEKTFTMTVVNYDDEGFMTDYSQTQTSGSPLSSSVAVTANDTKSQAILFYNGNPVSDADIGLYGFDGFSAEKGTAADFGTAVSNYVGEDYSVIEGKSVQSSDTITVKAVKSDEETAEEAFSNAESIYWYGAVKSGNGYSFKIPFSDGGQYYIEVTRYNKDGESENKYYKYHMIDTTLRQACIDSFMNFEADGQNNLSDCIAEAVDNLGIITADSLINRSATETLEFAQTFADIRDIIADSEINSEDLIKMLNTATVVHFLKQGDNSYMTEYSYLIEGEVKDYVEGELGYSFDADVKAEFDTKVSVTNLGTDGRLIFRFTGEEMDEATLTTENIILEKNGTAVEYEILLSDSSSVSIDKAVLETGGKYKISFSGGCLTKDGKRMTEVKSFEFTAGEIANIPYKQGKIIKNVALDKPVTGEVDIQAWRDEPNSIITDGKTNKSVLFKQNETIVIDLKDYYDICAVEFSGHEPGLEQWYHNNGVSVLGSDISSEFKTGEYSVLFRYSESQTEIEQQLDCMQIPLNSGRVKYLALKKSDSVGILMREIKAYAYVDTEFGQWETESFNGAGEYTFTIPVTENIKNNTCYMLISAYDQNGQTLKTVAESVNSSAGLLSAKINAPEGSVGITASLVSDIKTMCALTDSITIGECIENDDEASDGFTVNETDSGLMINVSLSDEIKKSSRVVVTAVKTTETGKTAKDAYTQMNADELEENTVFLYAGKCGNGLKLCLDNLSEGKYYINTAVSSLDSSVKNIYYKYAVISDEAKQDIISGFMSSDEAELSEIVNNALNVSEVISSDALADVTAIADQTYNKLMVYTRDLLYTESEKAQADKLSDVIRIMNATSFVKALYDADSEKVKEMAKDYATLLGKYYDNGVDTAKLTAVFADIKDNIKDAKSLGEVLNWSKLLSFMKNSTSADIAQAMRKYETELGIDVDYASKKNVSLERTVDFMDFNNMKALFGKTAFNNAFKAAADKAGSNGNGGGGSSSRPVSGGGGGIGISGSSSQSGTGNNVIKPVDKVDTSVVFADMNSYLWANDAVKALKEKGIVDGTEYGTFEPERNITRAEFIKMLVMAADIRVDESVYMSFIDVPDGSWYYPYIRIAYSKNICSGVSDYYFNPDGKITRQDMAVLADNFMKAVNITTTGEGKEFTDSVSVADYAQKAVASAAEAGIINGFDDGSFRPLENTRRVDAAMVIYKLIGLIK